MLITLWFWALKEINRKIHTHNPGLCDLRGKMEYTVMTGTKYHRNISNREIYLSRNSIQASQKKKKYISSHWG